MNIRCLQLFSAMCCVTLCSGQVADGPRWWETITTTAPDTRDPDLLPFYDDLVDESHVCCECVPYYLCSDNNTIIADGGHIIGPRFGGTTRVQNVEMCPDVTMLCCRPPTAPVNCDINKTTPPPNHINHDPNTPCDCVHWEFCPEEIRISDGSVSTTLVEGSTPLQRHAKCQHSLEVCCAFDIDPISPVPTPPASIGRGDCVCLNSWLCGEDGFVITDGTGSINLRELSAQGPPCVPPQVCCQEPPAEGSSPPPNVSPPRVAVTTPMPSIEDQRCNGIRNRNGISVRIAGFQQGESQFGEFPWAGMVLRTYFVAGTPMNAFIGGAIIINPRVMLTAAHKVANEAVASLSVRVGEWDIETDYEPGPHQVLSVESVIIHPSFDNRTLYHDVALLILSEPVVFYPHIRSICLASSVAEVDQSGCVANGWGEDSFDTGNYQTVMKSVTLPLVPSQRCQALLRRTRLGRWFRLHPSFICAGGEEGVDACSSDGGGPLACPRLGSRSGEYLLVGITAWGIGCGEKNVPGVYASTMADNRWIMAEVDGRFPSHSAVRREVTDSAEEENVFREDKDLLMNATKEFPTEAPTTPRPEPTTSTTTLPTTKASSTPARSTTEVPTTTKESTTTEKPEEATTMRWSTRGERRNRLRHQLRERLRRARMARERRKQERRERRNRWRH